MPPACPLEQVQDMSLKKIAEITGASPATVSRVLNNPDYRCAVEGMREKIWKAAMECNYVPNQAAKNLKSGRREHEQKTYYINVLMTRTDESRTDPFFSELLRIIESEIHKNFCILSKIWYKPIFSNDKKCRGTEIDRVIEEMYTEGEERCDGLVIIGRCNPEALKKLAKRFQSIVSINRNSTNYEVDEVLCDGKKISSIAIEYLISLGHTKIGYVGSCHSEARFRGFEETMRKHELFIWPEYIIETKQTEAEGYKAMERFLQLEDGPTGIYCANDITAIGMLKYLNQNKNRYLALPSIVASDDIEEAQFTKPMLTTVSLPKKEMGRFAMYLLVDRMKNGHTSVVRTEFEGKLMIRSSCYPLEG